jgi:hypothetical protein
MNSSLKIGAILVLVVLLVFGATVVSMYTGNTADTGEDQGNEISGPPLVFAGTQISYTPGAENSSLALFPGYYEIGEQHHRAAFWFYNPHPVPIRFSVLGRTCTSCTLARVGYAPPGRFEEFQTRAVLDALPVGGLPRLPVLGPPAGAALLESMSWHDMDFDHPDHVVEIPAAPPGGRTWGAFVMFIKVTGEGPKTLSAGVGMAAGNAAPVQQAFTVTLFGMKPFEVTPKAVELGELAEGAPPQTRELYYWSATREQADLPPPQVTVNTKDPFLRVGSPTPLDPDDRAALAVNLSRQGSATRVLGAYKIPLTVYRRLPDASPNTPAEPDIGPFDRQIGITGPAGTTQGVTVSARVTGLVAVALASENLVDLKDFNGKFGTEKTVNLVSDKPDLTLQPLPGETKPAYLKVELSPPQAQAMRRYWTLKVIVPPGACNDELPTDSAVAFQATTKAGTQKVRIPVKGRGFERGR